MFLETISTVYWSAFGWFEWNLAFFTTVATDSLGHCSWTETASFETHFLTHLLMFKHLIFVKGNETDIAYF